MKNANDFNQVQSSQQTAAEANAPIDHQWTDEEINMIQQKLINHGCQKLFERSLYILFKEVINSHEITQDTNLGNNQKSENSLISRADSSGVNLPFGKPIVENYTDEPVSRNAFLSPLDVQKSESIANVISSFKAIQSDKKCINIGFDTEFQNFKDLSCNTHRNVLSLQMTISVGDKLIRYFFLIKPDYQEVTKDGGMIPLKYCLTDILNDLRLNLLPELPLVLKRNISHREMIFQDRTINVVDYSVMRDYVIPITIICHTGKADLSVFRRSKYDTEILKKLAEIQGGWMNTKPIRLQVANDLNRNYYWLINLNIRDTLGLTPADHKSVTGKYFSINFGI